MQINSKTDIKKVVKEELILTNIEAKTKREVIETLVDLLYREKCITQKEEFINDVFLREEEGSTGLGQGIAIPHGKSKSVIKTSIAIATLKNEILWEEPDEKVTVLILFAVQDKDINTTHILLLQQVAIMLADEKFIENIKNVKTEKEVFKLFVNK